MEKVVKVKRGELKWCIVFIHENYTRYVCNINPDSTILPYVLNIKAKKKRK